MITEFRWNRFKKSGNNVNIAAQGDVFVLTEEQRHIVIDYTCWTTRRRLGSCRRRLNKYELGRIRP
jgi:hypothetical protein